MASDWSSVYCPAALGPAPPGRALTLDEQDVFMLGSSTMRRTYRRHSMGIGRSRRLTGSRHDSTSPSATAIGTINVAHHPQSTDNAARDRGDMLDVGPAPVVSSFVDDLLRRGGRRGRRTLILPPVVSVVSRVASASRGERHPRTPAARDDRDLRPVGALGEHADECVADSW